MSKHQTSKSGSYYHGKQYASSSSNSTESENDLNKQYGVRNAIVNQAASILSSSSSEEEIRQTKFTNPNEQQLTARTRQRIVEDSHEIKRQRSSSLTRQKEQPTNKLQDAYEVKAYELRKRAKELHERNQIQSKEFTERDNQIQPEQLGKFSNYQQ